MGERHGTNLWGRETHQFLFSYHHPFLLPLLSAPPLSLSHLLYSLCSPFRACVSHPFLFLQIYTIFLTSASIALEGDSKKSPQDWLKGLENGINAIRRYGGADIGDRTMVTTYNHDNYKYYNYIIIIIICIRRNFVCHVTVLSVAWCPYTSCYSI